MDSFVRLFERVSAMNFVMITGPEAVGKMTVGQELSKITDLKLFHNHMTIDLVSNFFSYGTDIGRNLVDSFRMQIFEAVAKSELNGIIFTCAICYNLKEDWEYIEKIKEIFKNADIYFVELEASLEERLKRNKTENRILNKTTKRDILKSEKRLLVSNSKNRHNSYEGEIKEKNYLKINNENKSAKEVAKIIKEKFNL